MSRVKFEWRGDDLIREMRAAARVSVNEIADEARDDANATHEPGWVNRPTRWSKEGGQLEEETISEHALTDVVAPTAAFGTTMKRGFYGLFHELGTVHEHERPWLRPAADRHFTQENLVSRIRERFFARRFNL